MKVKATKTFSSPYTGNAEAGKVYEVPDAVGKQMEDFGLCEMIVTKKPTTTGDSGKAKQSESSQAGQASKDGSVTPSQSDTEQSLSTAASSGHQEQQPSMGATGRGGSATTKKSRSNRRSGRKTRQQQRD